MNGVIELLETLRQQFLKHDIDEIKQGMQVAKAQGLAPLFSIESEYSLAVLQAERAFVEKLIAQIEKDGGGFLKKWKEWHNEKILKTKE